MSEYDKQRDIEAEGQRAAIYHARHGKAPDIDWKKILRAYIAHIGENEGIDYLEEHFFGTALELLTDDERRALMEIGKLDRLQSRGQ